jgi:HNH endonuclease
LEERYEVTRKGAVRMLGNSINQRHGQILKHRYDNSGYAFVRLYRDGKAHERSVHKLVTEAFLGACPDRLIVNHEDGDKSRPVIDNLEYVTVGYNNLHAFRVLGREPTGPELRPDDVRRVRSLKGVLTAKEAAAIFLVAPISIRDIWNSKTHRRVA